MENTPKLSGGAVSGTIITTTTTSDVCINDEPLIYPKWMYSVIKGALSASGADESDAPLNTMIKGYFKSIGLSYDYRTAWCAVFANYHMGLAEYETTNSAGSLSFSWSKHFQKMDQPVFGCIVVFKNYSLTTDKANGQGYVGFFFGCTPDNKLIILGGNQGDQIRFSARNESSNVYLSLGIDQRFLGFYLPVGVDPLSINR